MARTASHLLMASCRQNATLGMPRPYTRLPTEHAHTHAAGIAIPFVRRSPCFTIVFPPSGQTGTTGLRHKGRDDEVLTQPTP